MERRVALIGVGGTQQRGLVEHPPVSCTPIGSPVAGENPHGTLIAGRPVRLALTVKMSSRYIWSGSLVFSPSLNAGVGVVGVAITSARSNARS